jgi:hypothetical protein
MNKDNNNIKAVEMKDEAYELAMRLVEGDKGSAGPKSKVQPSTLRTATKVRK